MKCILKLLSLVVVFLFVLPFVSAGLVIDPSESREYNLGDLVTISGKVSDTQRIIGYINISVDCINRKAEIPLELDAGKEYHFTQSFLLLNAPVGDCRVLVGVLDLLVPRLVVEDYTTISITDSLNVNSSLDKVSVMPGSSIMVLGTAKKLNNKYIESKKSRLVLDDNSTYDITITNGVINYPFVLGNRIKSYNHKLDLYIEDIFGNKAQKTFAFSVIPVPTTLNVELSNSSVNPEETILFKPILLDQAGDLMEGQANIELVDPTNKKILAQTMNINTQSEYTFPKFASPGSWKIKIASNNLNNEAIIIVKEIKLVTIDLVNYSLEVHNVGNVKYDIPIKLKLVGSKKNYSLSKSKTVGVDEILLIDLTKDVKTDTYDIYSYDYKEAKDKLLFSGVSIIVPETFLDKIKNFFKPGTKVVSAAVLNNKPTQKDYLLAPLFIILFFLLLFLIFKMYIKRKKLNTLYGHDFKEAQKKVNKVKEERENPPESRKKFDFQKVNHPEQDVKDFREQILKNIREDKPNSEEDDQLNKPY